MDYTAADYRLKTTELCSKPALIPVVVSSHSMAAHVDSFPPEVAKRGHAVLCDTVAKLCLLPSWAVPELAQHISMLICSLQNLKLKGMTIIIKCESALT